nr:acyltransferase family protein [Microbulbifer sp. CAU 1566]
MYRPEIDGLRAIAVVLVVLFHLKLSGFEGGFVGVDIFFVISGFLITGIVLNDLGRGKFSLADFYMKRVARLIPALLATLAGSLLLSAFIMTPEDLVYTAKQAISAVFSFSNVFYWSEAGYWDSSSYSKVFLHTWSLGVEEQFYLLYPLTLVVVFRLLGREGVLAFLVVGFLVGLAACEYVLRENPSAAFYLMPLRIYQFALGGLGVFLIKQRAPTRIGDFVGGVLFLLGLMLVIGCAVIFSDATPFPGVNALPLSLGTLLMILWGSQALPRRMLANSVARFIGKSSYSIYLVHWPLIVLYQYRFGGDFSLADMTILFALTLISGVALYQLVESKFRFSGGLGHMNSRYHALLRVNAIFAGALLVCGLSFLVVQGNGWSWRLPDSIKYLAERTTKDPIKENFRFVSARCKKNSDSIFCGERKSEEQNIILLADSRGNDTFVALSTAFPSDNIYMARLAGCPPVFDTEIARTEKCQKFNSERLQVALNAPVDDVIFLAMEFNEFRAKAVLETAKRFKDTGKRVFVVGQTKFLQHQNPLNIAVTHGSSANIDEALAEYLVPSPFSLDGKYAPEFEKIGVQYIGNKSFFYEDGYRIYTRDRADLLMYDMYHLTLKGAKEYGGYLKKHYQI